jgi:hypothetical protein
MVCKGLMHVFLGIDIWIKDAGNFLFGFDGFIFGNIP